MLNRFLRIFALALFTSTFSYSSHAADFCVADLTAGHQTSSGYPCKNPKNVTVDDFVFSGLVTGGNTTNNNINRAAVVRAFVGDFPALNGLNLAAVRVDIAPGGAVPLHSHPYSSEMIYVVEGNITAGFISGLATNYSVYVKELKKGEIMVIPQGLFHFQVNNGTRNAVAFVSFGSADPGAVFMSSALFGNDFSSWFVEKTTKIGEDEVKKLKALLGGSG